MTDEVVVNSAPEDAAPEVNPIETQAREQGWVPKDDFQGEEVKWVDAGEFLRRGELFKKIDQVSRTAKRAEQTLEEFKKHYARVKDTEYQHALATLKAERRGALVDGDFEKVEQIETRMEEVKADAVTSKQEILKAAEIPELPPELTQWIQTNDWYQKDMPMKAYADKVGEELNRQGLSGSALLRGIDAEVRKAFPAKFTNPNRERAGSVEGSSSRTSSSRDSFQLSEQEQRIMQTFVRDGVMTKAEYIADLKRVKGIK